MNCMFVFQRITAYNNSLMKLLFAIEPRYSYSIYDEHL